MVKEDYSAAEKYVFNRLKEELPQNLYYHDSSHTQDAIKGVEKLGKLEIISEEELLLLKTAALYHDTGFLEQYQNNEPIAVELAKESLPNFGYNSEQIEIISDIIMATQLPQSPKTKLEELMCDADLDNLGRDDFYVKAEQLRRELSVYGISKTPREWYKGQITFLEQHRYFTKAARELRQRGKEKHINEMKELLGVR